MNQRAHFDQASAGVVTSVTEPLAVTTQGPLYPPSEICDAEGNFVVVGAIPRKKSDGKVTTEWGAAIVSSESPVPPFGEIAPYTILRMLSLDSLGADAGCILHTLPLPLPCTNYQMIFAPEQCPDAHNFVAPSRPLHDAVPDFRVEDGRQNPHPITPGQWVKAGGQVTVDVDTDGIHATFCIEMDGLVPLSLYTVMSLREFDLRKSAPTRPGPLGIPNCFVTDEKGHARYVARMRNPFPAPGTGNRIVNIVVLFMSTQASYGGAIGLHGLGADIHAQLKIPHLAFSELITREE
ncbi:hypothetical protein ACFPTO_08725 [Paraburkholderia denitrificans]|uniref:Uncharacterized protein n=1 Tax=Paraburkholderia denitrificans TaxID=694025 RepID=A0ABW0J758_9BURK